MLDRVAVHQTRLRTPGLGLDAKGVALGAKGLVLLPTVDRLVALLAIYTREQSLEAILPSVALRVVRSSSGSPSRSSKPLRALEMLVTERPSARAA